MCTWSTFGKKVKALMGLQSSTYIKVSEKDVPYISLEGQLYTTWNEFKKGKINKAVYIPDL